MRKSLPQTIVAVIILSIAGFGFAQNPHTEISLNNVTLDSGFTMQYAERGHGKGQVIIFLHGYLDSWFSFSTVMENLPPKYHAYALTQRGHGDSDKPAFGYSMKNFAVDVIAFMDHFGIHSAHLVGHSMGSVIAQRVAIDFPDRVEKLVLIGSGADITSNEVLLGFEEYVLTLESAPERTVVEELQFSTIVGEAAGDFMDGIVDESLKVPLFVWQDALIGLNDANHLAELENITAPTMIAWGAHDEIFIEADQEDLINGIPDVTLVVYQDLGHSIQWEQPLRFTLDLISFLEPAP